MDFDIFLGAGFRDLLNQIMHTGYDNLALYLKGPFRLLSALYLIFVGYEALRNPHSNLLTEFPYKMLRVGVIWLLITDWSVASTYIFNGMMDAYESMGGAIVAGTSDQSTVGAALGASFSDSITVAMTLIMRGLAVLIAAVAAALAAAGIGALAGPLGAAAAGSAAGIAAATVLSGSGVGDVTDLIGGVLYLLCSLIFHGIAFYSLIMTQITLALVVIFAPLFIVMFLFNATRPIADSWIRTVIAMVLMPAAMMVTLGICTTFTKGTVTWLEPTMPFVGPLLLNLMRCLIWIGMGLFLLEVPGFIQGMVGSLAGPAQATGATRFIVDKATQATQMAMGAPPVGIGSGGSGGAVAPPYLTSPSAPAVPPPR